MKKNDREKWAVNATSALIEGSVTVLAVLTALACGAFLVWMSGADVVKAYGGLFAGMAGSPEALAETCAAATPYMLTGLAVAVGFQQGLFNIGAEGQFYMGALCAATVGFGLRGVPAFVHLPLAAASGVAAARFGGQSPAF